MSTRQQKPQMAIVKNNDSLPFTQEAEESVLGGLIIDNSALEKVINLLIESDFYLKKHRIIFSAILSLAEMSQPFDILTISEQLKGTEITLSDLAVMAKDTPSTANIGAYAAIVKEDALRRDIINNANKLILNACQKEISLSQILIDAIGNLSNIKELSFDKPNIELTASELIKKNYPSTKWIVEDMIPTGVSLLVGAPKIGKSWLIMDLCIAIAAGGRALGNIQVDQGKVLYIALEDNFRRLQSRLIKRLQGSAASEDLHFITQWPRIDSGCVDELKGWIKKHPEVRLIVIDTLAAIRPLPKKNEAIYISDYAVGAALLPIAAEFDIAIVLVHHTKKGETIDELESVSGSTGLTGGVDNVLIMRRKRNENIGTLYITGRDIENENEYTLKWDNELAQWSLTDAVERLSPERRAIIDVLKKWGCLESKSIAEILHPDLKIDRKSKEWGAIRRLLEKLIEEGYIYKTEEGGYILTT